MERCLLTLKVSMWSQKTDCFYGHFADFDITLEKPRESFDLIESLTQFVVMSHQIVFPVPASYFLLWGHLCNYK